MNPEEREALHANEVGDQISNETQRAIETAKDVAKGTLRAGKAGYRAGKTISEKGLKDGVKSMTKDKVNGMAPVKAAKATVELSKLVKQKGAKAGAKAVAKGAAKAAANMAKAAVKKVLIKLLLPGILIAILFIIIFANTPAMILSGIGIDSAGEQEKLNSNIGLIEDAHNKDIVSIIEYLFTTARNWYYEKKEGEITVKETDQEVTQEELDKLAAAGDYDGVLSFYVEVTQRYLDMSYEDTVSAITDYANGCAIGNTKTSVYDAEKTIETIEGNPFTDTDYANIIAVYSTTDDYDTALLSRYKDKLRNAEGACQYNPDNPKPKFLLYSLERKSKTETVTEEASEDTSQTEQKKEETKKSPKTDKKETTEEDTEAPEPTTYEKTTYWDEVTLIPFSVSDTFEIFEVDPTATYEKSLPNSDNLNDENGKAASEINYEEAYSEYYTTLKNKLDELGYISGGDCVSWGNYGTVLSEKQIKKYLDGLPAGTSGNRKQIIKVALDAVGRIPYNNTGTRSWPKYGVNPNWGKPSSTSQKHPYVGLDCSGFVQWVYRNALCDSKGNNPDSTYNGLGTTGIITSSGNSRLKVITRSQLKPGDLGTRRTGGSTDGNWNHVGIYLGDNTWIHCSGGKGTVVVSEGYNEFHYYYRATSSAIEKDNYLTDDIYLPYMVRAWTTNTAHVTDDEITVIATTLHNEFGRDDGFRACAEAVYHYSKYNHKSMYEAVKLKNYLDAYTRLYVTNEWDPSKRRATSKQYKILDEVMDGDLRYFPYGRYDYPVMYFNTTDVSMTGWRAKGVIVERITADNGKTVVFFYCKGVTYKGYH
ncbi:MAG: C40 family peptidase [Agathobacter sp.]